MRKTKGETFEERLRNRRADYFESMREKSEQSQGTVGEEADGKQEAEPGRVEIVVEQVGGVELHDNGGGCDLPQPEQEVQEAAPKVAPKKRGRPKKRG